MTRRTSRTWPDDWEQRIRGEGCSICSEGRPDESDGRLRVYEGGVVDAYLNRDDAALGYVVAYWRGPHVAEATELSDRDAALFWAELMDISRGIEQVFKPAKLNFLLLGNNVPHLHAHIVPRYVDDPDPGRPPRFMMAEAAWKPLDDATYLRQVAALRRVRRSDHANGRTNGMLWQPHREDSPERFQTEAGRVHAALGGAAIAIEHVGSTAVPGLPGKPTVDVLVGVDHLPPDGWLIEALESIGYEYRPEHSTPDRHYFRKGPTYPRESNIHIVVFGDRPWADAILFRDYLRSHPQQAEAYGGLKREASREPDAYGPSKATFIVEALRRARSVGRREPST